LYYQGYTIVLCYAWVLFSHQGGLGYLSVCCSFLSQSVLVGFE
jgi:hypothetical protein